MNTLLLPWPITYLWTNKEKGRIINLPDSPPFFGTKYSEDTTLFTCTKHNVVFKLWDNLAIYNLGTHIEFVIGLRSADPKPQPTICSTYCTKLPKELVDTRINPALLCLSKHINKLEAPYGQTCSSHPR